jgi:dihydrofolate synthase/folylpolyglutamate synthase
MSTLKMRVKRTIKSRMAERSLGQWLNHLERLHPNPIDLGLARVAAVAHALQLLPVRYPTVAVAGTNGKGSVSHVCDAVLTAQGMRCGRYTSPHLLSFNERICVDGTPVDDDVIVRAFVAIETARAATTLTYFEFATLAALCCFREIGVDAAVFEVGLGGRLDAVNIIDASVAVITSIALDHQQWLGGTVEKIAIEKAGIARARQPVVLAEDNYPHSVDTSLKAKHAEVLTAGSEWSWTVSTELGVPFLTLRLAGGSDVFSQLPVPDGLRPANVAAGIQAAALIAQPRLDRVTAASALAQLRVPARRQLLKVARRDLVLDVAHNPAAMAALTQWLCARGGGGSCYVALGLMEDKDLPAMVEALAPAVSGAFAVALPGTERAQAPERIWQVLDSLGIAAAQSEFTIATVWDQLMAGTKDGDCIVFCGSFHTIAGIMSHLDLSLSTP